MKANTYQELAMKTLNQDLTLDMKLANGALGLCGEAGEVADHIKKHLMQGHSLVIDDVAKELGDVLWYVALLCHALNLNMGEVAEGNIAKLKARFGDKFSVEKSVHRLEG